MRKKILLPVVIIFLTLIGRSNSINNPYEIVRSNANSKIDVFSLTVTCLSDLSQAPGGFFLYNIKLTNLSGPVPNADVKINDPFGRVCTWATTNADGNVLWTRSIPLNTKPQLYVIEFFYEDAKQYSKVAVSTETGAILLPTCSLDLSISKTLDDRSLVFGSRGGFSPGLQTVQTMLKEGLKFGDAVIKDFWKNPFNKSVVVFGGISCLAAPGNPVCIAAVTISLKEIIKSELKVLGYGIIDATNLSKREKDFIKNMLDLVTIRISVGLINPAEGLSDIEAISSGYEFIENAYKLYGNVSDELKGVSFAAQKKGSNEVVIFTIYNGELLNQSSKDPNCDENFTGDYFFQNNTNLSLQVSLVSSPKKNMYYTSPLTATLQPGERQGFYDVPEGVANYKIITPEPISSYGNTPAVKREYNSYGQLYVDRCKENTFVINLDGASYSTSNPELLNVSEEPKSKNPECIVMKTGDFCFQNTTDRDLQITFLSSPVMAGYPVPVRSCTIQPGQEQCFFDVPAGAAKYEIRSASTVSVYGNSGVQRKEYFAQGQLYVDACKTNFFVIK